MILDYFRWRKDQIYCKLIEESRRLRSGSQATELALLGANHETNVGDIALRIPFERFLNQNRIPFQIQNLYSFQKYKSTRLAIVAGGANGVEDKIQLISERYHPENVVLCGVDFPDVSNFRQENRRFLESCAFISTRSKSQFKMLKDLGFKNVSFSYDNAFSLATSPSDIKTNRIGFNMLNLFMMWNGRRFVKGTLLYDFYKKKHNDIQEQVDKIGPRYIELFNTLIDDLSTKGYALEHVPFTPEDDFFARYFITNTKVRFIPFSRDPVKLISRISTYQKFYSTRYHSLIFGLLARTTTVPFLYSKKCTDLISDLDFSTDQFTSRDDLVYSFPDCLNKFLECAGISLSEDKMDMCRENANESILQSFSSMGITTPGD